MSLIAVFVVFIFLYGLVSGRLERTVVTAPIVFTLAGVGTFLLLPQLRDHPISLEAFLQLAEIGLVLLLFTDASRTKLQVLKNIRSLPTRLLSTGMVLSLLLGAIAARFVFPELSLWETGILAAILAPTDAGLGQIIVSSPRVPLKIREALNVEAGLNDGLSVPFLLFFIAIVLADPTRDEARLTHFILEQLGYGAAVGVGIGLVGGWLLGMAHRRKWMASSWCQLAVVMLPLFCAIISTVVGASMFIAAFVAGLAVQKGYREVSSHSIEFTEEWGQLINLSVFFLFGLLVSRRWHDFTLAHLLYATLSLTVVRMVPVMIALVGSRLSRATVLFMGWFGPRGLASIVLGLVYLEHETKIGGEDTIRLAVMVTVLCSIFVHGLSAKPGIGLYARRVDELGDDAPERSGAEQQ